VIALHRFARSRKEEDFQEYQNAINVPLGDHVARLELEKPNPNYVLVDRGFLQGGNHPGDLKGMSRLFRRFRRISYMAVAIDTWTQGDRDIARLQELAASLHDEILSARRDQEKVDSLVRRIDEIDIHLTPLENRFSEQKFCTVSSKWTACALYCNKIDSRSSIADEGDNSVLSLEYL
jgi:hypothetical protein